MDAWLVWVKNVFFLLSLLGDWHFITFTSPCNLDLREPHYCIVKLGGGRGSGVYIISSFSFILMEF